MIASGLLLSVASIAFSFARPLDRLSSVLPLSSIFHPALILSVLGQLLIHGSCMYLAVTMAKAHMGESALKEVTAPEPNHYPCFESFSDYHHATKGSSAPFGWYR